MSDWDKRVMALRSHADELERDAERFDAMASDWAKQGHTEAYAKAAEVSAKADTRREIAREIRSRFRTDEEMSITY